MTRTFLACYALTAAIAGALIGAFVWFGLIQSDPNILILTAVVTLLASAVPYYYVVLRGRRNELWQGVLFIAVGASIKLMTPPDVTDRWISLLIPIGIGFLAMTIAIHVTKSRLAQ